MRTKIQRHPERDIAGQEAEILEKGILAHVGFCENGQPVVIPFSYHYDSTHPDCIYLHGSPESRALKHCASGDPICIEVTSIEGLVYSRDAKFHSMNYKSVVCFGKGSELKDEAKKAQLFEAAIRRYFPGRTEGRDYTAATSAQLRTTLVVEIKIEEWSAKGRDGGPRGPRDAKEQAHGTRGVIALTD